MQTCEEKGKAPWLLQWLYDISKGKDDNLDCSQCSDLNRQLAQLSKRAETEGKSLENALSATQVLGI